MFECFVCHTTKGLAIDDGMIGVQNSFDRDLSKCFFYDGVGGAMAIARFASEEDGQEGRCFLHRNTERWYATTEGLVPETSEIKRSVLDNPLY